MGEFVDRVVKGTGVLPNEVFARQRRQNPYARQGWLVQPHVAGMLQDLYDRCKTTMESSG